MEQKHDKHDNNTGLGCLFAILLAVVSVFIPFVVIWILTLSGIGLKYSVITYFGAGFALSIFIIILMTFDVKSKSVNVNNVNIKDNENSDKSNHRQD